MRLVLASTSAARLAVLQGAGITPAARFAPTVDEEAALAAHQVTQNRVLSAAETVQFLARIKAESVIAAHGAAADGLVLGGDSMFLLDGEILGKPHLPEVAMNRARAHRGKTGVLYSGHWLAECRNGEIVNSAGMVDTATVRLNADVTDAELAAYIATGEPLELAGGFAIDGLAGAFIDRIEGTPSCVMGLSLPALRVLVHQLGHEYVALWGETGENSR